MAKTLGKILLMITLPRREGAFIYSVRSTLICAVPKAQAMVISGQPLWYSPVMQNFPEKTPFPG